jgi:quercetin dioxygenase-like cupin family protein
MPIEKIKGLKIRKFNRPDAPLIDFLYWYVNNGNPLIQSPVGGIGFMGTGPDIVLHREDCFQVQLFIGCPNTFIPIHNHPNVESYEMNVNGDVEFYVEGDPVYPTRIMGEAKSNGEDILRSWGYAVHVPAGANHHARMGPRGGSFLSIQKWLKGTPTSVDHDWVGSPMNAVHMELMSQKVYQSLPDEMKDDYQPYMTGMLCD